MIEVKNLIYKIPKGKTVLENVNFTVWPGEFLGVLGRNGAGKTTLLDLMMGFRPVTEGSIKILEENPQFWSPATSSQVVFISQDIKLQKNYSVKEHLNYHSAFYKDYDHDKEKELLKYFELSEKQKIGSLSTGQQKKVQIIGGLCVQSKIIIIDEITAVLDPETRLKFFKLIEGIHKKREKCIILATNIVEDLKGRVDRVLFIDESSATHADAEEIDELFNINQIEDFVA